MKGYKGFDNDLKCRGFQYEIGKTYECEGKITLCENGFHFCEDPKNVRGYYADLTTCRYCEVEALGKIINGNGKCVCSKITIVREIPLQEFLSIVNEGSRNIGWMNKGDDNKGNWNEGNGNEGDWNKGNWNKGYYNIGLLNRGSELCGVFNTDGGCVIFNKYTKTKWTDIASTRGYFYLSQCISKGREPSECELKEIEKLPNFSKRVMNELIFEKKEESK